MSHPSGSTLIPFQPFCALIWKSEHCLFGCFHMKLLYLSILLIFCFLGLARNAYFCFFLQLLTALSAPFLEPLSLSSWASCPFIERISQDGDVMMWWKYDKYRILILWLATCLMQAYCNIRLIFHHRFGVPGAINWYYCICWFFKKWQYLSL